MNDTTPPPSAVTLFRLRRIAAKGNPHATTYPPDRVTDRTAEWRRKSMGLTARPRGENLETCFQSL